MAELNLVRTDTGDYLLQGTGDRSQNADFSLFDLDGEGGDPFALGCAEWEIISEIAAREYDPADHDSFWTAQQAIVANARRLGMSLPDYVD